MSETNNKEPIATQKLFEGERGKINTTIRLVMPYLLKAIDSNMNYFGDRFPDAACKQGIYPVIKSLSQ